MTGLYNDYSDKQERQTAPDGGGSFVTNAGSATIYGIETEILSRPIPELELTAMVSYLHARYDEFLNAIDQSHEAVTSDPQDLSR